MKFDDVLAVLSDFGTYQKVLFIVLCSPLAFVAMQYMAPVFILATPDHRCAIPGLHNDTYEIQSDEHKRLIDVFIPLSSDKWALCEVYDRRHPQYGDLNTSKTQLNGTNTCDKWVYDKTYFSYTIATEMNLVCTRTIFKAHVATASVVGALIGFLTLGPIADRFGRRRVYLLAVFLMSVFSTLAVWLPNIYVYIAIRVTVGFVQGVLFNTAFIYVLEFIGLSKRALGGILINYFWASGMLIQTGMAYQLRSWRHLQLAMSVPFFVFLVYWCFIPESARWLLSNGKLLEGQAVLQKMAKMNKVTLTAQHLDIELEGKGEEKAIDVCQSLLQIFKNKTTAVRSFIVFFDWFVVSLLYYGLSLNLGHLGGSIYVTFAISAGVELIAYTVAVLVVSYAGRKKFYCLCMLVGGASLLASGVTDMYGNDSLHWLMVALAMVGKLVSSAAYATIILFTAELFPTVIRSSILSMSAICGCVGNIVAPYIVILGDMIPGIFAKALPLLVFGICSVIAGFASLILPETGQDTLPDTVIDIKRKGKLLEKKPKGVV